MTDQTGFKSIEGTGYYYDAKLGQQVTELKDAVTQLRSAGKLSPNSLRHLRQFFRVKNIYHSNAIEGNVLSYNETRLVVEQGLTVTGKPLKDSLEAKNLSHAL